MKSAVVQLPGLNRDRDMVDALTKISGKAPVTVWQTETEIPDVDLIVIPGGFSYGDYLRCGAIAARMPVMDAIRAKAEKGVKVLGVCNGFQILVEAGLLPGALMRNAGLNFVCRSVPLKVENSQSLFTSQYDAGEEILIPVAHHDGNFQADAATLDRLEGEGRVAFRYRDEVNGSARGIAGILNDAGN
ncbi:MAG TPA: phosphoribosylformylglycinamidine synthase subunit PurQ, partial [Pseudorhizobium sp.]|nr:phosphoribosylformylglycinamidine synthase subunit PurQ [Pseudorhizobium sp.]